MQHLRANTQVIVTVGPFVDVSDGYTPQTDIALSGNEAELIKHGSTTVVDISGATWAAVTNCRGYYSLTLTTSHTDTEGLLIVVVQDDSDCLPVKQEYMVLSEAAWDSLFIAKDTGFMDVNIKAISEDETAPDNLEAMYDGTGYIVDTAPAARSQVDGIGAASGGALNFANEADNIDSAIKTIVFDGTESSGTNASANAEDSTYHQITGGATSLDIVYQFDVGGGRTATEVIWKGYLSGSNDEATIQGYNGSGWDTLATINGKAGTANETLNVPLLSTHTGTGSDLGKVFIRIECAGQTSPVLYTDQLLIEAVNIGQSIGYSGGSIWVDTGASNTNTEAFVDGVADNPVSTWAAALTLSSSLGITDFHIANGSSITLSATSDNYTLHGEAWTLALGSRSIEGLVVFGATVTGTGTATVTRPEFHNCSFGAATVPPAILTQCGIGLSDGQFTAGSAGEYVLKDCFSVVAGSGTPDFVFTGLGSATGIHVRGWMGGAVYTLDSDCKLAHEVLAGGGTTITTGGGDAEIRGICRSLTLVCSAAETVQFVGVTGPIAISGTTTATINLYGVSSSMANTTSAATVSNQTLSLQASAELLETTVSSVTSQTVFVLSAGSDVNDAYNGQSVVFYDVTNSDFPSVRTVLDYVGSSKTLTIDTAPDFTVAGGDEVRIFVAPATTLAADAITAATIAADAITSSELAASAANKIADHTLRRTFENAIDSSDGDTKAFRSLLGAIAKLVNKLSISGTTLTITEDDDTTTFGTQSVSTDPDADPVIGIDTS